MTSMTIPPQTSFNQTFYFNEIPLTIVTEKLSNKITVSLVPQQNNKIAAIWQVAINDTPLELDGELFTLQGVKKISFEECHDRMMALSVKTTEWFTFKKDERFVIWRSDKLGSQFRVERDAEVRIA